MLWDDLEDGPDAPWHVDPKDSDPATEEHRQRVFLRDVAKVAPSLIVWAVPNAGKRTSWEVGKAKREGMVSGALDLTIAWNHGVAFIEFKAGSTAPTANQRIMLNRLYRAGHHCGVFRTSTSLIGWLKDRGAPVRLG
jgi:hypothetical protein